MSIKLVVFAQLDGNLTLYPGLDFRVLVLVKEAALLEPVDNPSLLALFREYVA
jgi:hypothetical protein